MDAAVNIPASFEAFLRGEIRGLSNMEADLVYGVGASFYEREDHRAALDLFRLLVLGRPKDARSWTSLAICHEAIGDTARAIALYELAVAAPNGDDWRDRARVYFARALWGEARFADARDVIDDVAVENLSPELRATFDELRAELQGRRR